MTHKLRRAFLAFLSALLATGGLLAVTTAPASAATVSSITVTSTDATTVYGESVSFLATVVGGSGTPTGTVTFLDGVTPLCSNVLLAQAVPTVGAADCPAAELSVSAHSITVEYTGVGTHDPAASPAFVQTVGKAAATTALSSGANPSVLRGTVTFTVTVATTAPGTGTATGTVAFKAAGPDITDCAAKVLTAGITTCATSALAVGTTEITAVYATSTNYLASTSTPVNQVVAKAATTSAVASSDTTTNWGGPVTFTATISAIPPATIAPTGGTVSFNAGGIAISGCATKAMTAAVATCLTSGLEVGANSITAVYSGDSSYLTSISTAVTQKVAVATTTTAVTSDVEPSRSGQSVTFTAR